VGEILFATLLAKLYTHMIWGGQDEREWKHHPFITLLTKADVKCKSGPNNYRSITLSSSTHIYKMILLLLQDVKTCFSWGPVLCQKIIDASVLDAWKAFDRLWLDGLFYKLLTWPNAHQIKKLNCW